MSSLWIQSPSLLNTSVFCLERLTRFTLCRVRATWWSSKLISEVLCNSLRNCLIQTEKENSSSSKCWCSASTAWRKCILWGETGMKQLAMNRMVFAILWERTLPPEQSKTVIQRQARPLVIFKSPSPVCLTVFLVSVNHCPLWCVVLPLCASPPRHHSWAVPAAPAASTPQGEWCLSLCPIPPTSSLSPFRSCQVSRSTLNWQPCFSHTYPLPTFNVTARHNLLD